MTFTKLALAGALAASAGLALAADPQTTRQERMDAAYDNYQSRHGMSGTRDGMSRDSMSRKDAGSAITGAASPETGGTGNFKEDAKTFGRGMKNGAKQTGHSIAEGARDTGHEFAKTGRKIKDKATGKD